MSIPPQAGDTNVSRKIRLQQKNTQLRSTAYCQDQYQPAHISASVSEVSNSLRQVSAAGVLFPISTHFTAHLEILTLLELHVVL
jgi:hypothetical protein